MQASRLVLDSVRVKDLHFSGVSNQLAPALSPGHRILASSRVRTKKKRYITTNEPDSFLPPFLRPIDQPAIQTPTSSLREGGEGGWGWVDSRLAIHIEV
jgi:hypothetical protein